LSCEAQQSISCSQPQLIRRVQRKLAVSSSKQTQHNSMRKHLPRLPKPAAFKLRAARHFKPAELRCICTSAHNLTEGLAHARLHCCLRNKPAGQQHGIFVPTTLSTEPFAVIAFEYAGCMQKMV
jgi:hypothetical protein